MRLSRAIAASAAALAMTLAGCADEGSPAGGGEGFNQADVDFATDMIQHHAQALEMVDLAMGRPLSEDTAELTEAIRAAQAPEIEQMADWLDGWGEPVPETSRDHANAHGDDMEMDGDMPGMMSAEDMESLESASDEEFEALWLQMMTEHHEGAVAMAEEVLDTGESPEVAALAEDIVEAQEAEIATMEDLLAR